MRLILASASPRRAELLANAGFEFEVVPAHIDETPRHGERPAEYVRRLAEEKAAAVARRCPGAHSPILAADTAVVVEGRLFGKPVDAGDARSMLADLSGRQHEVLTGVALVAGAHRAAEVVATKVRFTTLSDAEIDWYVASGETEGKAGAYAIQGLGSRFVESIEGSWSNVVGLPIAAVYRLLRATGRDILTKPGGFAPPDPPSPSLAGPLSPRSAPAGRACGARRPWRGSRRRADK